jgi:DNA invertase Pin-like site-specific DNA recombinase
VMRYGYARVSSNTQGYAAQIEALKAAGCKKIYSEKRSGKSAKDRPEFSKLMRVLLPGDVVVVTKLDRLARSSRDLVNILHELTEKGCGFVSLGESWCDTTSSVGRLMLTIMSGVAQFERELIRNRCDEGIARVGDGCACPLKASMRLVQASQASLSASWRASAAIWAAMRTAPP